MALNRAVAVAEVDGPQAALDLVDALDLDGYHLFHSIRADLLRRLGRTAEAAAAYEAAIAPTENVSERTFLERRRRGAHPQSMTESGSSSSGARSGRGGRIRSVESFACGRDPVPVVACTLVWRPPRERGW